MVNIMGSELDDWRESGVEDFTQPVLVTSCGYQQFLTKDYSIARPRGRGDYQIIYLVEGGGDYGLGTESRRVESGHIVVYEPWQPQHYRYHASQRTTLYWVHATGSALEAIMAQAPLSGGVHRVGSDAAVTELFDKMVRELQLKRPAYRAAAAGCLVQVVALLARKAADPGRPPLPDDIGRAVEALYAQASQPYSATAYAGLCHLSVSRFIHKFREVTGQSPLEFLTGIRVANAKELLASSAYNIGEVAAVVGYDNPLYFSRVFRKLTGQSPSEFRQTVRERPATL